MVLVDTNAWIGHLRARDPRLVRLLSDQRVHTTDVIIGELLLGSGLPPLFARSLQALPRLTSPSGSETHEFVVRHARVLAGAGVGWADVQILISALKHGARLYTSDAAARRVARSVGAALA